MKKRKLLLDKGQSNKNVISDLLAAIFLILSAASTKCATDLTLIPCTLTLAFVALFIAIKYLKIEEQK